MRRSGLWKDEWASGTGHEWFTRTVDLLRPRVRLMPDFSTWSRAFFSDDFPIEAAAEAKFWKDPKVPDLLAKLADALAALPEWNHDACDHALRALCEAEGVKAGLLINATRVAIVGQAVAPAAFRHHGSAGTRSRGEKTARRRAHHRHESMSFFTASYRGDFLISAWSLGLLAFLPSLSGRSRHSQMFF